MADRIKIVRPGVEDGEDPRLAPGERFMFGREYEYIGDREIFADMLWLAHVRRSRLDEMESQEGESAESYGLRIYDALSTDCLFFRLLSTIVKRPGEAWTPESAARNAAAMCRVRRSEPRSPRIIGRLLEEVTAQLMEGGLLQQWDAGVEGAEE